MTVAFLVGFHSVKREEKRKLWYLKRNGDDHLTVSWSFRLSSHWYATGFWNMSKFHNVTVYYNTVFYSTITSFNQVRSREPATYEFYTVVSCGAKRQKQKQSLLMALQVITHSLNFETFKISVSVKPLNMVYLFNICNCCFLIHLLAILWYDLAKISPPPTPKPCWRTTFCSLGITWMRIKPQLPNKFVSNI